MGQSKLTGRLRSITGLHIEIQQGLKLLYGVENALLEFRCVYETARTAISNLAGGQAGIVVELWNRAGLAFVPSQDTGYEQSKPD